jgi:MipA family protein
MILGLLFGLVADIARAADQKGKMPEQVVPDIFLAGGALFASEFYSGLSQGGSPMPLSGCEGERFHLSRINGGYRFFLGEGWSIGPVLQPRAESYKSGGGSVLDGLEDRRFTVDAGVGLSWQTSWGSLSATWVTDMLGRHKGFETEFAYALWFPWKGFDVIPSAGVRCRSSDLTSYYYGVEDDKALSGRPSYKAGSAIDPFVRIAMKKRLAGRLSMLGAVQCEWFDNEIRDSPVVDRAYNASLLFGLLYTF